MQAQRVVSEARLFVEEEAREVESLACLVVRQWVGVVGVEGAAAYTASWSAATRCCLPAAVVARREQHVKWVMRWSEAKAVVAALAV